MKIAGLCLSPGHNYFGHHGGPPGEHPLLPVEAVDCVAGRGLRGDRFFDYRPDYPGQITFFALETHEALRRELGHRPVSPALYRRNVLTRGADLNALVGREFTVQGVRFSGSAECKPCHWMDRAIGPGAEPWLRGRGGLRARILTDGVLRVDDAPAAAVLLAGGRSQRMGSDKAGLPWGTGTLADHQAAILAETGAWPLLHSCRAEQPAGPAGFLRVEDGPARNGAAGAIAESFARTGQPVLLVLAVDLPLMPAGFLRALARRAAAENLSVVPRTARGLEPLAAAWHRSAVPRLREAAERGESFQAVCAALAQEGRVLLPPVPPEEEPWFLNLNTPADLARAGLAAETGARRGSRTHTPLEGDGF